MSGRGCGCSGGVFASLSRAHSARIDVHARRRQGTRSLRTISPPACPTSGALGTRPADVSMGFTGAASAAPHTSGFVPRMPLKVDPFPSLLFPPSPNPAYLAGLSYGPARGNGCQQRLCGFLAPQAFFDGLGSGSAHGLLSAKIMERRWQTPERDERSMSWLVAFEDAAGSGATPSALCIGKPARTCLSHALKPACFLRFLRTLPAPG